MTQRNSGDPPAMRSRQERAMAQSQAAEVAEAAPPGGSAVPQDLEDVRRAAEIHGFSLSRRRRAQHFKAQPEDGRVRTACSLPVPVRNALEMARLEFNVPMSEILERATVYYLIEQGLQVDGVSLPPPLGEEWVRSW